MKCVNIKQTTHRTRIIEVIIASHSTLNYIMMSVSTASIL